MKDGKRCTAIVLCAGSGSRMKSSVAKQYMDLAGHPVIRYPLRAIEESAVIDDCILVAGQNDLEFVREEIVRGYGFSKVDRVIAGGAERYLSVWEALQVIAAGDMRVPNRDGFVFIHDGARPFLTEELLGRLGDEVARYHACVAAVPSKDTIKITDEEGFAVRTPDRRNVRNVQTPQVFDTELILEAYGRLARNLDSVRERGIAVTDDASVVELFTDRRVRMTEGDYRNIKITTPEDLAVAEAMLKL
ncbi:MAG: 2-C-methyl-D-erythritol 4-phosphate cytidylyltransferase [Clostridium sp.]|nr:2-C-methyl-D-erythritol 4-phosphate cytidylyltransferase [Acetatifactor muris]MCM1526340.1 2-C-methyl-D-erythritol 4-phosphate cytidylyltransferase [Bacteroides sp.]MCM1562843.1 2-C-methyl-D-erythritol 4-phosphate cytidylyltransferase [Clostridium sp.]